jgi:hypothetical protein
MDASQFGQIMAQAAAQQQQQLLQMQQNHAQQLQQFAQQIAAAAPNHAAQPRGLQRLPPPASFEGRATAIDDWVADLTQQMEWYATPAGERVRFAAAFLRGAARDWYGTLGAAPASWPEMQAALRGRFQPVNSAESARAKLIALVQGKRSVNEYVDDFRRLLVRVPTMDADDRLFQFTRGLNPQIATQIRVQGVSNLDAAIAMAVRIGGLRELGACAASSSSSSSGGSGAAMELDAMDSIEGLEADTSAPAADAPVTRAEFQQLLNAMRDGRRGGASSSTGSSSSGGNGRRFAPRGPPTIPHLTPEQVKEYMDSGKCFGCGSKDHRSRQCPKRKVGADGRVSWLNK